MKDTVGRQSRELKKGSRKRKELQREKKDGQGRGYK